MDDIGLIDVFRKLYPNERSFTYESKSLEVRSRIGQDFRTAPYFIMHTALCLKKTIARISNAHF